MNSLKKNARLAGFLYLIMGIAATYGLMYFPALPIEQGDSFENAKNILNNEFLFRTQIATNLVGGIVFIFLAFVLYRLFRNVNEYLAKLMVVFVILQIPIDVIYETFHITSLMILKGEIMKSIEPETAQDLAMLFLNNSKYAIMLQEIFWGLWLIPFGLLVYKSGFIPRILGVLLIIGGMAYILESFTFLLFPGQKAFVSQFAFLFYSPGELLIILWLLIKGVKTQIQASDDSQRID